MEATPLAWGCLAGAGGVYACHPPGSHLIEDHREIHVDTGGIQLHGALRNQVLMHPPQLGPLLPILGDDYLLIEFVSQIPILVIEHGAAVHEYEVGHDWALR